MQQPTAPTSAPVSAPAPAPAALPALPRLAFFGRVLWFCAFPLATVILGNLVLFEVDQAKEAMEVYFDAVSFRLSHLASFLLAYWAWALSTWYCARLLLGRRFPVTAIGNCVGPVFAARLVRWLPRVLAVLATLPTAIYLLANGQWLVGVPVLLLALALLIFVVWRRSWPWAGRRIAAAFSIDAALGEQWEHFDRIDPIGKALLWLLGLGPWGVLVGLLLADPGFARTLGAPGLLLLALAAWTVFGSMVLIYCPLTRGWSALVYVPLVMFLAFSFFNDNHVIGQREGVSTPNAEARPDVAADFARWLKAQAAAGRGSDPIYLVAMSGGASRAAYWGAYTLGWLEDEARGAGRPFAADIYAISGVSGGSLGAAAFVTALASEQAALQQKKSGAHRAASLAGWMGELLGRDDLSPVVGMALFPDLVARLSPRPIPRFDRSQALELTWEQDTRRVARAEVGVDTPPWFACPLEALHEAPDTCPGAKPAATPLPHLVLNSASARTGRPVLQASLDLQHPSAIGGRNPVFALDGLTLSGAVHNSARFPYLSPAGLVLGHNGATVDYWVDGGYFENSGVWALQALLHEMSKAEGFDAGVRERLRVIVFSNDPVHADSGSWLPQPPAPPPSGALAKPVPPRTPGGGVASQDRPMLLAELFAPPEGLFTARAARADAEVLRLAALLRDDWQIEPTTVIRQLQLPATFGRAPSMNWFINHRSTCVMRSMVLARDECGSQPGGVAAPLPAQIASAPAYQRYRQQLDALHAEVLGR